MKLIVRNDKAHRPSCKRVEGQGSLVEMYKVVSTGIAPASCCYPQKLASWKEIEAEVESEIEANIAAEPVVEETSAETVVEETPAERENVVEIPFPKDIARHFFRALAVGGEAVALDYGATAYWIISKNLSVYATLPLDHPNKLQSVLEGVWAVARENLKAWRASDPTFLQCDRKTKQGAAEAYRMEQEYLTSFCHGVVDAEQEDGNPTAYRAGRDWAVL